MSRNLDDDYNGFLLEPVVMLFAMAIPAVAYLLLRGSHPIVVWSSVIILIWPAWKIEVRIQGTAFHETIWGKAYFGFLVLLYFGGIEYFSANHGTYPAAFTVFWLVLAWTFRVIAYRSSL